MSRKKKRAIPHYGKNLKEKELKKLSKIVQLINEKIQGEKGKDWYLTKVRAGTRHRHYVVIIHEGKRIYIPRTWFNWVGQKPVSVKSHRVAKDYLLKAHKRDPLFDSKTVFRIEHSDPFGRV